MNEAKGISLHSINQWETEGALLLQGFKTRKEQCLLQMADGEPRQACLELAYRMFEIWEDSERERLKLSEDYPRFDSDD